MRNGFDIYRVGPDRNHQEPQSPWGWTPRRGEVPTGETVVQDHDFTLTVHAATTRSCAAAFARGARLMEIVDPVARARVLPLDGRRLPARTATSSRSAATTSRRAGSATCARSSTRVARRARACGRGHRPAVR